MEKGEGRAWWFDCSIRCVVIKLSLMGIKESNSRGRVLIPLTLPSPLEFHSHLDSPEGTTKIYKHQQIYLQSLRLTADSPDQLHSLAHLLRIFSKQERNLQRVHFLEIEHTLTCGKEFKIHLLCDYYNYTLKDLTDNRKGRVRFSEENLWYILKVVVEAGYFLQKRKLVIGDIKPSSLYVSRDHLLRIPTVQIRRQFMNSCHLQGLVCLKEGCRVSPEQLLQLKEGKQTEINYFKSDVWALGMTLLECMAQRDSTRYYRYTQFKINHADIRKSLQELKRFYSPDLINLVEGMLAPQQDQRCDFVDLCQWLDNNPNLSMSADLSLNESFSLNPSQCDSSTHSSNSSHQALKHRRKFSLRA